MSLFALIFVVTSGPSLGTLNPTHVYPTMAACEANKIVAQDWANSHQDLLKSHGVDQWAFVCSHTSNALVVPPADPNQRF